MTNLEMKHSRLIEFARQLNIRLDTVAEQDGRLRIAGVAPFQMQKDQFWDALKAEGAQNEVEADIKVANVDYYGDYTIKQGDTLSGIAQRFLGDAGKYRMIAEANPEKITDPDRIRAGDTIRLPMAAALH